MQLRIFQNAFTFGCWCHYALTVTVSWFYVIIQEWWSCMHFIHAEDSSLSTKSNFMHISPWSNGALAFSVPILTFPISRTDWKNSYAEQEGICKMKFNFHIVLFLVHTFSSLVLQCFDHLTQKFYQQQTWFYHIRFSTYQFIRPHSYVKKLAGINYGIRTLIKFTFVFCSSK